MGNAVLLQARDLLDVLLGCDRGGYYEQGEFAHNLRSSGRLLWFLSRNWMSRSFSHEPTHEAESAVHRWSVAWRVEQENAHRQESLQRKNHRRFQACEPGGFGRGLSL